MVEVSSGEVFEKMEEEGDQTHSTGIRAEGEEVEGEAQQGMEVSIEVALTTNRLVHQSNGSMPLPSRNSCITHMLEF